MKKEELKIEKYISIEKYIPQLPPLNFSGLIQIDLLQRPYRKYQNTSVHNRVVVGVLPSAIWLMSLNFLGQKSVILLITTCKELSNIAYADQNIRKKLYNYDYFSLTRSSYPFANFFQNLALEEKTRTCSLPININQEFHIIPDNTQYKDDPSGLGVITKFQF